MNKRVLFACCIFLKLGASSHWCAEIDMLKTDIRPTLLNYIIFSNPKNKELQRKKIRVRSELAVNGNEIEQVSVGQVKASVSNVFDHIARAYVSYRKLPHTEVEKRAEIITELNQACASLCFIGERNPGSLTCSRLTPSQIFTRLMKQKEVDRYDKAMLLMRGETMVSSLEVACILKILQAPLPNIACFAADSEVSKIIMMSLLQNCRVSPSRLYWATQKLQDAEPF